MSGERWLKTEPPIPGEPAAARLDELVDRLAAAFDTGARELGLPARGPAVTEFGWRALVIGVDGSVRTEVRNALANSGFLVRSESSAGEPRELKLSERPDLVAVIDDPDRADSFATASAWSGAGPVRPRSIVLISRSEQIDRVRALAAGIDSIIPAERVAVDLPSYAKTLARIGSPPPRVLLVEHDPAQAEMITHWLEQVNAKVTHCT